LSSLRLFSDLVDLRWEEAQAALCLPEGLIDFGFSVGDDYPHFAKARGYAVCFWHGRNKCRLLFSTKMLKAPRHRSDAIIRHELGHVLDFVLSDVMLSDFCHAVGVDMPSTDERKADALAEAIWGEAILYDGEEVQSLRYGVTPRPAHLGL